MEPGEDGRSAAVYCFGVGGPKVETVGRGGGGFPRPIVAGPLLAQRIKEFSSVDIFALPVWECLLMDAAVIQPAPFDDDFRFAERCLAGNDAAIEDLRDLCQNWIRSYLVRSGAKGDESGILVATLLTDCIAATKEGGHPLLATYLGQCPLRAWLARVALNRLISFKRTQQRELQRFGTMPGDREIADFPDDRSELTEEPVLQLIRDAINCGFKECEPESLVMLQLLHTGGLHPDEIASMFGCVSTTVTRTAERASATIRATIMAHVRERDPWLELAFDDLLAICRTVLPECLGEK